MENRNTNTAETSRACTTDTTPAQQQPFAAAQRAGAKIGTEQQSSSAGPNTTALSAPKTELAKKFASCAPADDAVKAFGYDKLDAAATKREYDDLNAELDRRCEKIAEAQVTLDEATPYLARMQALTSQRGSKRQKMLREAGVPTWTEWASAYAKKLNYSIRTIQMRIKELRGGEHSKSGAETRNKPPMLRASDRKALLETALNFNELVMAHDAGRPIEAFITSGKRIMDAKRLDDILQGQEVASPEADYKALLNRVLETVEMYGEKCPVAVTQTCREITNSISSQKPAAKSSRVHPTTARRSEPAEPRPFAQHAASNGEQQATGVVSNLRTRNSGSDAGN